jgi:hypothetical protein
MYFTGAARKTAGWVNGTKCRMKAFKDVAKGRHFSDDISPGCIHPPPRAL